MRYSGVEADSSDDEDEIRPAKLMKMNPLNQMDPTNKQAIQTECAALEHKTCEQGERIGIFNTDLEIFYGDSILLEMAVNDEEIAEVKQVKEAKEVMVDKNVDVTKDVMAAIDGTAGKEVMAAKDCNEFVFPHAWRCSDLIDTAVAGMHQLTSIKQPPVVTLGTQNSTSKSEENIAIELPKQFTSTLSEPSTSNSNTSFEMFATQMEGKRRCSSCQTLNGNESPTCICCGVTNNCLDIPSKFPKDSIKSINENNTFTTSASVTTGQGIITLNITSEMFASKLEMSSSPHNEYRFSFGNTGGTFPSIQCGYTTEKNSDSAIQSCTGRPQNNLIPTFQVEQSWHQNSTATTAEPEPHQFQFGATYLQNQSQQGGFNFGTSIQTNLGSPFLNFSFVTSAPNLQGNLNPQTQDQNSGIQQSAASVNQHHIITSSAAAPSTPMFLNSGLPIIKPESNSGGRGGSPSPQ